jgi:hypothetical protein
VCLLLVLFFLFFILDWKKELPAQILWPQALLIWLILIKILLNLSGVPHGLKAWYYNNRDFSRPYERSTEFRNLAATRIDPQISFANVGYSLKANPFNLWFLNSHNLNNFDFSIRWKGFIYLANGAESEFSLSSCGQSRLYINRRLLIDKNSFVPEELRSQANLSKGQNELELHYISPGGLKDCFLRLMWQRAGEWLAIGSEYLYPEKISALAFSLDKYQKGLYYLAGILAVLALCMSFGYGLEGLSLKKLLNSENFWLFLFFILLVTKAFLRLLETAQTADFNILSRGDDWLTFQLHARNILLGDWLNRSEAPFYFAPFYRYFLAILQLALGEGIFMQVWAQYFLLGLAAVLIYKIASIIFGFNTAVIALLWFSCSRLPNNEAQRLLSENLGTCLSCAAVYLLVRSCLSADRFSCQISLKKLFLAGLFLGLAIITRPNILPYLLFIVPWLYFRLKGSSVKILKFLAVFAGTVTVIISLVSVRNYLLTKRIVLLTASVTMNLWEGNTPPPALGAQGPVSGIFSGDERLRLVTEYIRREPLLFLKGLLLKLMFICGVDLGHWVSAQKLFYPDKMLLALLFVLGVALLYRRGSAHQRQMAAVPAGFVLMMLLTLIIVKPVNYGWRLQLPAVPFMSLFAAYFTQHWLGLGHGLTKRELVLRPGLTILLFHYMLSSSFFAVGLMVYFSACFFNNRLEKA